MRKPWKLCRRKRPDDLSTYHQDVDGTKDGHLDFESINPLFDLLLLLSTDVGSGTESLSMTELRRISLANAKPSALRGRGKGGQEEKEGELRRRSTTIEEADDAEEDDEEGREEAGEAGETGKPAEGDAKEAAESEARSKNGQADGQKQEGGEGSETAGAQTEGEADGEYEKAAILLHGGGGSGSDWTKMYRYG